MKHVGRNIIGFLVVVTAAQLFAFHHYNAILAKPVTTATVQDVKPSGPDPKQVSALYDALKLQYPLCSLSQNDELVAYVDTQNVLHMEELVSHKSLSTTNNTYPIDYIVWIGNDSLLVGEKEPGGSLLLKRVDANTGAEQSIYTFAGLLSTDDIQKIAFSTETNDTYVLVGNTVNTVLYHFDTNDNITNVDVGNRFLKNIAVTQTGDTLYFEDFAAGTFNIGELPLNGQISIIDRNRALIGVVGNSAYTGTLNSAGLVTAVYKDDSVLVKTLATPMKASDILLTQDGQILS